MTRRPRAFTLIEVLVAIAVAAILAASLYMSLHAAFRARRSMTADLDSVRAARLALAAIGRDLTAAVPPTGVIAGSFVGERDGSAAVANADTLSFFAAAAPAELDENAAPTGDVRRVSFTVRNDDALPAENLTTPNRRRVLERGEKLNPLESVESVPYSRVLCRDVTAFNVRYYDGKTWADTWDSSGVDNTLPIAVEVTLGVDGGSGPLTLSRVFRVPCGKIAQVSSSGGGATP